MVSSPQKTFPRLDRIEHAELLAMTAAPSILPASSCESFTPGVLVMRQAARDA
ncbi:MAG TPA: hypothetical protein VN041_09625 [Microbacterium sp.]|nr:hypothetical protein [Microbacterium sp.]